MKKLLLVCLIVYSGCLDRTTDEGMTLVLSNPNQIKDPKKVPPPPPSPYSYYGCFNFVFDTSGALYFYQHYYDRNKKPIRVIDFDSDAPVFINLNPDEIVIIPEDATKGFVEQNVLKADNAFKSVRVIGATDTIKSKSLAPLMNILADTANHILYSIRKTTLEENVVLGYKKRQAFYYPDKVNWDTSKIWFDRKRMR